MDLPGRWLGRAFLDGVGVRFMDRRVCCFWSFYFLVALQAADFSQTIGVIVFAIFFKRLSSYEQFKKNK